jgi:hypothetical protein
MFASAVEDLGHWGRQICTQMETWEARFHAISLKMTNVIAMPRLEGGVLPDCRRQKHEPEDCVSAS